MLSIRLRDTGLYEITTLLEHDSSDVAIATVRTIARRLPDSSFRLGNYLLWAARAWPVLKTAHITYHYPPGRTPDIAGARRSEAFLQKLARDFSVPLRPLQFYVFDDCEDSYRLAGLESHLIGPHTKVCGCLDDANDLIFSGGRGFYYPHELTHLVNRHFPEGNELLLTGLSGLLGGHRGKPLSWHQPRALAYMEAHPEADFNNITDFHAVDEHTNPQYVVFLGCSASRPSGRVGSGS